MRSLMYWAPSGKESSATSPPCFWNWGTATGAVLKTRQGALPAVMAAPMTSSELLPAGISWASIFWSGWAEFHDATMALPHFTSNSLFEYQILMGPLAVVADSAVLPLAPPPQPARPAPMMVRAATDITRVAVEKRFIASPWEGFSDGTCQGCVGVVRDVKWGVRVAQADRGSVRRLPVSRGPGPVEALTTRRGAGRTVSSPLWVPASWFRSTWAEPAPTAWGRWPGW